MCPNEIRDVSPLGVRGFIQFHALKDFATPGFESDPRSGEVPKKPNNHHLGGAGIHYYSSFNHFYVFIDIHDTSIHPSIHPSNFLRFCRSDRGWAAAARGGSPRRSTGRASPWTTRHCATALGASLRPVSTTAGGQVVYAGWWVAMLGVRGCDM